MKKEQFEDFIKIASALSILITCAGSINLFFYYRVFGINIFEYIGLAEVITSSVSLFLNLLFPLILAFLILKLAIGRKIGKTDYKNLTSVKHIWIGFANTMLLIFIFLSLFGALSNSSLGKKISQISSNYSVMYTFMCVYLTFCLLFSYLFNSIFETSADIFLFKKVPAKFIWVMMLTLLFYFNATRRAYSIIEKKQPSIVTFLLANENVITTNDNVKYVGKTEQCYFIWINNSRTTVIYPVSEVKKIEIIRQKSATKDR